MKALVIAFVFVLAASAATLGGQNPYCRMGVHLMAHEEERECTTLPVIHDCTDMVLTFGASSFDAVVVCFDLYGITGAEYGLEWPDWSTPCVFTSCSDLTIGSIVWPHDGISQAWDTCQIGYSAVCGWGWLIADSPGMIHPRTHRETGFCGVFDCHSNEDWACLMASGVYGVIGDDPCEPTGTEASTWGSIKTMFR